MRTRTAINAALNLLLLAGSLILSVAVCEFAISAAMRGVLL